MARGLGWGWVLLGEDWVVTLKLAILFKANYRYRALGFGRVISKKGGEPRKNISFPNRKRGALYPLQNTHME